MPAFSLSLGLGTLVPAFLTSLLAGYAIRRCAPWWGLTDHPNHRKMHTRPTPLGGGVAIWLGVLAGLAIGRLHLPDALAGLWPSLAAASSLMVLGLVDDRWKLTWRIRLVVQAVVAVAFVAHQGMQPEATGDMAWFMQLAAVLWIVILINSFNMLDNMDALLGAIAFLASILLALHALTTPMATYVGSGTLVYLFSMAGGIVGFLWHNRPVAKLFMGDAGSYFIGFAIAAPLFQMTWPVYLETADVISFAPLCIVIVPLYDICTVMFIRLRRGKSLFEPDRNHVSHRLVARGMSEGQAVLTLCLLTAVCGAGAVLMPLVGGLASLTIAVLQVGVLATWVVYDCRGGVGRTSG